MASKLIRDFVYVEKERLYSLYSQVFGGVAELIVQSTLDDTTSIDSPSKMRQMLAPSLENQIAQSSLRTENTILLDDIYNRLEEKISRMIVNPTGIDSNNYVEKLQNTFLIKVRGKAEIEDYDRVKKFTEQFNEIADTIAYSALFQTETMQFLNSVPSRIEDLKKQLTSLQAQKTGQGQKSGYNPEIKEIQISIRNLETQISSESMTKMFAQEMGLRQDDQFLKNMGKLIDFFYRDGFEITISPEESSEVVYRGVLEEENLRLTPQYLRALFGGFVSSEWVMVGQVTYLPGTRPPAIETPQEVESTISPAPVSQVKLDSDATKNNFEDSQEEPNDIQIALAKAKESTQNSDNSPLRDPMRGMFKALAQFDTMFFESKERKEILVRPLAIYREFQLELDEKESES